MNRAVRVEVIRALRVLVAMVVLGGLAFALGLASTTPSVAIEPLRGWKITSCVLFGAWLVMVRLMHRWRRRCIRAEERCESLLHKVEELNILLQGEREGVRPELN